MTEPKYTDRKNTLQKLESALVNFNEFCEESFIGLLTFPIQVATDEYLPMPATTGGKVGKYLGNTASTVLTAGFIASAVYTLPEMLSY